MNNEHLIKILRVLKFILKILFLLSILIAPAVIGITAIIKVALHNIADVYAGVACAEIAFLIEAFAITIICDLWRSGSLQAHLSLPLKIIAPPAQHKSIQALRKKNPLMAFLSTKKEEDKTKIEKEYLLLDSKLHPAEICPITYEALGTNEPNKNWVLLIDGASSENRTNIAAYCKKDLEQWLNIKRVNPKTNLTLHDYRIEEIKKLSIEGENHYYCDSLIRVLNQIKLPEKNSYETKTSAPFFKKASISLNDIEPNEAHLEASESLSC